MTAINLPAGLTSIGNYAFYYCSSMATVSIPAGVTTIGDDAFRGCSKLESITLPAGLTSIGDNAFYGCSNLANVNIPATVTSIGDYAFRNCSKLESITLPAGLTTIGSYAFYNCSSMATVNIPDGVTTIGGSAFYGCSNLTNVTIPDGVTSIGNQAFYNCDKLESITLPVSVTIVGSQAFRYCSLLTEVNIFAVSLQTYGNNAFRDTHADLKIYVPSISLDNYKADWSAYADKFVALPYYALTMKEGTVDADKWTVKVGDAEKTVTLPITNLEGGETITLKYNGRLKVKSVKATSDAAPAEATPALSITIAVDPSTTGAIATAPAMTIEFNTGETWADVAARYDWLDTYETYTVYYKDDKLMGDVHDANGGVKPDDTIDPNGSYHWGM